MHSSENHWAAWQQVALDSFSLWVEAGQVIWLRSAKLAAGGPAANVEAVRMVEEKLVANWQLAGRLFGALPLAPPQLASSTVRHYRDKVAANQRRLSR